MTTDDPMCDPIDVAPSRLAGLANAPTARVPVIGEGDGPPIGSAQVGGGRATITMAVDVPADPAGRSPIEVRVGCVSLGYGPRAAAASAVSPPPATAEPAPAEAARLSPHETTHGTAIPPDAELLPCPFCGSATLTVGVQPGSEFPRVTCGECGARRSADAQGYCHGAANREATANWNRRKLDPVAAFRRDFPNATRLPLLRCSTCGTGLLYSARQRGDGLCGPCSRIARSDAATPAPTRPPRTSYRDGAGVYHPATDARLLEIANGVDIEIGAWAELGDAERFAAELRSIASELIAVRHLRRIDLQCERCSAVGTMPRCGCGKWSAYLGRYDADGHTLRCNGCMRAIAKCTC
jgi:hypothetical protein